LPRDKKWAPTLVGALLGFDYCKLRAISYHINTCLLGIVVVSQIQVSEKI